MKIATTNAPLQTDPAATARLHAALDAVLAASDRISLAVTHFARLAPDQTSPASWVTRATDLHLQLLEAWWALDDAAAIDAAAGGWTVGPPHAVGTPLERRRIRTRWEAEWLTPTGRALRWDRLVRELDAATTSEQVEAAGRALVAEGARRRYAAWTNERTETT